mgnify:CR=1 FL=1
MNDEQMKNLLQKNQPLPAELTEQQKTALLDITLQRLKIKKSVTTWMAIPTGILAMVLAYNVMINNVITSKSTLTPPVEYNALNSPNDPLEDSDDEMALEFPTLEVGEEFLTLADSNQIQ